MIQVTIGLKATYKATLYDAFPSGCTHESSTEMPQPVAAVAFANMDLASPENQLSLNLVSLSAPG